MSFLRRRVVLALAGTALISASSLASAQEAVGPLTPGRAAGVQVAQGIGAVPWVFLAGGALLIGAVVLALTQDEFVITAPVFTLPPVTTTTTTTTTTTP